MLRQIVWPAAPAEKLGHGGGRPGARTGHNAQRNLIITGRYERHHSKMARGEANSYGYTTAIIGASITLCAPGSGVRAVIGQAGAIACLSRAREPLFLRVA